MVHTVNSLTLEATPPGTASNDRIASNQGHGNLHGNPNIGLPYACHLSANLRSHLFRRGHMPGTTRKHTNGAGLPCPAYRLTSKSTSVLPSASYLLKTHSPTIAFKPPDRLHQAPGTNPAAAEVPALFMLSAMRVSWLRGCYSSGRMSYVRPSGRHSFPGERLAKISSSRT